MSQIQKKYNDPALPGSFSGISGYLKNQKYKNKEEVIAKLSQLKEYSLHKPASKKFPRRRVMVKMPNYQIVMDLIDLQKYARENDNYRYVLVLIDGFSRKLYTEPLKRKDAKTVLVGIKKVFKDIGTPPMFAQADSGGEFFNADVKAFLKSKGTTLFSTFSKIKASLCERVIRTIMTRIARYFTFTGKHRYIDVLQKITNSYNSTYHRA
jgi:hypothetical protein